MSKLPNPVRYVSPLRYPGGKGKVANFLKLLVLENSLQGIGYVEPYAGGASVALSLLMEGYVGKIHINDLNPGVHAFWRYVVDNPDSLCSRIQRASLSMSEWERQRAIYSDKSSSAEELGFATFFLNRTNRSGIISRGGAIGGREQLGKWKIDARFDKKSLCERIRSVAQLGDRITVTSIDAAVLLNQMSENPGASLLYLDPPYYVKGAGLYDNFYSHADHLAISNIVKSMKGPWVVSYDAAPEIIDMYPECLSLRYSLGYSAASASSGTEVMFFSPELALPDVKSPAGISIFDVQKYAQLNAEKIDALL
jgi:DNA adenine methylase